MPGEKVHLAGAAVLLAYLLPGAVRGDPLLAAVFVPAYLFSTLFLCPDLDAKKSACLKRWGRLSSFWRAWWRHVGHRGMSHSPVGMMVYVVLATLPPAGVLTLLGYPPDARMLGAYVAGIAIPHQLHVLMDSLGDLCRTAVDA